MRRCTRLFAVWDQPLWDRISGLKKGGLWSGHPFWRMLGRFCSLALRPAAYGGNFNPGEEIHGLCEQRHLPDGPCVLAPPLHGAAPVFAWGRERDIDLSATDGCQRTATTRNKTMPVRRNREPPQMTACDNLLQSTISTIRRVRGSTKTVWPLTTV
jgi:hypothetical protein